MNPRASLRPKGFTLVELLIVVATLGILAALLLPVLSRAKIRAQRTKCLSNLRQLGFAWTLYHQENGGWLAQSYPVNNTNAWVLGDMRNPGEALNPDLLVQGKMFPYVRDTSLYRCPADQGVTIDGKTIASVRSFSMNSFMGGRDRQMAPIPPTARDYVPYFSRDSELRRPSELWVLLDEDERSINDGFFVTDPAARVWYDFPAISMRRHAFSFGLSFADGHSEIWRHRDQSTEKVTLTLTEQPHNRDLERLAIASTVPK